MHFYIADVLLPDFYSPFIAASGLALAALRYQCSWWGSVLWEGKVSRSDRPKTLQSRDSLPGGLSVLPAIIAAAGLEPVGERNPDHRTLATLRSRASRRDLTKLRNPAIRRNSAALLQRSSLRLGRRRHHCPANGVAGWE